jgi:DNA repair and recombination protein RAD52
VSMFTDAQTTALKAPLSTANVKKNPRGYDYVEGWHAIAEANRIFGFDGWDRETIDMRQLGEPEQINGNWRVAYHCRVRITVKTDDRLIIRDGSGYGSGIVKDIRDAHESAIKEAETDAMKRALMTFGNPFGLALYDKDKSNVVSEAKAAYMRLVSEIIRTTIDAQALGTWWNSEEQKEARRFAGLENGELHELKSAVTARIEALKKQAA